MGEDKLNQVQEGGLDVTEREVGGPQVLAYFGTDVDWGEHAIRMVIDRVVGISAERSDKEWGGGVVEVLDPWNGTGELATDKFLR